MEVLVEAEVIKQNEISGLMTEAHEILKVVSTARKSVSENKK